MTLIDKAEALACCKVFDHWGPEGRQAAQLCRDAIHALPAREVGVPTERPDAPAHIVEYTNWRGETARRVIIPIRMWWGSTEWHPQEQWMLTAWDVEKNAARDFAWQDMRPVQNGATSAAVAAQRAALAPTDAAAQADTRPATCRFRLRDEGKPYGKSSCSACGTSVFTGLGNSCPKTPTDAAQVTAGQRLIAAASEAAAIARGDVEPASVYAPDAAQAREAALRDALSAIDALPEYSSPDVNIGVGNAYSAVYALLSETRT